MKQLTVTKLTGNSNELADISIKLDALPQHLIDNVPWTEYPYKPQVRFAIAHDNEYIFLKYYVNEKSVRAVNNTINGSVWEDSCVEFFIHFNDDKGYYNVEANCIGTILLGFGKDKINRQLLPPEIIRKIKFESLIIRENKQDNIHWELLLAIPLEIFIHHHLPALQGNECRVNFYKCGDLLAEPHFLCWNNIQSASPNFHLPEFFGKLVFE